ncbi:MAG: histidine--tRNA ligase [Candidatus Omnitrophota bacterium]|nr:MAG: histidine--tRNA ligase [Candidatus Omnitrophota bacterium]
MEDILPQDAGIWRWLEDATRKNLQSYGYKEIRTPILEDTAIFVRSIGETTDIVTKEMYTFKDRKSRSLTLRPEGTAPIVRAYIEYSLDKISPQLKLYYIGPMFRSEKPQKGRSRQFHQIGAEILGTDSPYADAELIVQLDNMLKLFGLREFTIKLNSLGCKKDKDNFAGKLKKYLEGKKNRLCKDCKERLKKNVLRVLDCKNDSCIEIARNTPNIADNLCTTCKGHFDKVKATLKTMKINFVETKNLVRGLDYYTGTVFEITDPLLGSQDAIGAGGRYDNLVKDLGGPDIPAVGYALGIERIIIALKKKMPTLKTVNVVYVATLGDAAKIHGIQIAEKLRKELPGIIVITDIKEGSLKSQMRNADKNNAKIVLILGENELNAGKVIIRDMIKKEQDIIPRDSVIKEIKKHIEIRPPEEVEPQ